MTDGRETEARRSKDGRAWRIGSDAEIAWIEENTAHGVAITCAIPPIFEAYATLELPDPNADRGTAASWAEVWARHEAGVLAVLGEHAASQPWWLGYIDTGATDLVFYDAPKVKLYADWPYVLVEAGVEQAGTWREDGWKGILPDLMFPGDRSWLFSTLWDDEWTCIGGSRGLVDAFLAHPDLRQRVREVDPSVKDATPPGHTAY